MQCLILAGGRGTRMAPLTDHRPKVLLPVADRPFLDWQLQWLAAEGIDRVVLSVGHLGDQVRAFAGDGRPWGLDVAVVDDGATPLGTGGAIRQACDCGLLEDAFFVLYGDSYLRVGLRDVWNAFAGCGRAALMTVYRNEGRLERSNAVYADGVVTLYRKGLDDPPAAMVHVDYGLSVLTVRAVAGWIPDRDATDLADTFAALAAAGELAGFEAHERFHEIGSRAGLEELEGLLTGRRTPRRETAGSDRPDLFRGYATAPWPARDGSGNSK